MSDPHQKRRWRRKNKHTTTYLSWILNKPASIWRPKLQWRRRKQQREENWVHSGCKTPKRKRFQIAWRTFLFVIILIAGYSPMINPSPPERLTACFIRTRSPTLTLAASGKLTCPPKWNSSGGCCTTAASIPGTSSTTRTSGPLRNPTANSARGPRDNRTHLHHAP